MDYASAKQMKFINDMRIAFMDYDEVIGDKEHTVISATDAWNLDKKSASKYIGANKAEFERCWEALTTHPDVPQD